MSHHNIQLVKGMLSKGQAFLSTPLKRQAMSALDAASDEFTRMGEEIERLKGQCAEFIGRETVMQSESDALKAEIVTLRAELDSKNAPITDNAQLVPVTVETTVTETVVAVAEVPTE